MTDKVIPSVKGDSNGYIVARIIELAGGSEGWIQDAGEALLADNDLDIDQNEVPLNAFNYASSSGLDVTIDTGEGFVGGSWCARDTQTTVSLADDTTNQTVYVGWDHDATETMIIGLDSAFGSQDPQISAWTFDTSGGTVDSATDERRIGKGSDLGVSTLGDGSEIGRWISTVASDDPVGTAGDQANEMFRAGSTSSDLVMAVNDGDGRLTLAYNAYFDGSWKFVTSNTRGYLLQFSSDEIRLRTSSSASGSADDVITWVDVAVSDGSILADDGTTIWNGSEVPQSSLGGPASSLSNYPIPAGDIADGSGSGLDSDTVDGYEASELQSTGGRWTLLDHITDTDDNNDIRAEFGPYDPGYDLYLCKISYHTNDPNENDFNEARCWIGGSGDGSYVTSSNYRQVNVSDSGTVTQTSMSAWENFGKHEASKDRDGHASWIIRGQSQWEVTDVDRHPTFGTVHTGGSYDTFHPISGDLQVDMPEVTDIRIFTISDAVGEIKVYGHNF